MALPAIGLAAPPKSSEANALARRGTEAARNSQWDEAIDDLRAMGVRLGFGRPKEISGNGENHEDWHQPPEEAPAAGAGADDHGNQVQD